MIDLEIPSWDELFMRHVYLIASKSKDKSTKIGSILVKGDTIISEGFNGLARGVNDNILERQIKPDKYLWFSHAEFNSICNCARNGISSLGSICYTNGISCANCTLALIQGGIKELVIHSEWAERSGLLTNPKWKESCKISIQMFKETNIPIRYFSKDLGLKGLCDGKIVNI